MSRRPERMVRPSLFKQNTLKPQIEALEERMAPGSLMDLLGIAALGTFSDKATFWEEDISSRNSKSFSSNRSAEVRTVTSELQQPWIAANNERIETVDFFDRWTTHIDDGMDFENLLLSRVARSENLLEIAWQGLVNEELLANSPLRNVNPTFERAVPTHLKAGGEGSVLLPGAIYVAGQTDFASSAEPAWPATTDQGMGSQDVSSRPQLELPGGSSQPNVDASAAVNDALSSIVSGVLDGESIPKTKVSQVEDHRLPPELQNRSDSLLEGRSLDGYAISYRSTMNEPTTGMVKSPTEYDPMRGVLFAYSSYTSVVTDMVKELTEDPSSDDIAYVVVASAAQQNSATNAFTNAGADMSKVQFFVQPLNSVWMRDYGPHFVTVDDALAIVDSHYYPQRPEDNFIPTLVGDNNFNVPTYDMGMYYSGGNFQPGPNGSGFVTALVHGDNPAADGFNTDLISELYYRYQGIETLHILPQLPFSVDATGHIDMWMYLIDEKNVIISEFLPGSNSTAIQVTNNAVGYMEGLGFTVHRTPAWNSGGTHYTYANAFRVNNRIFVPVYGTAIKPGGSASYNARDTQALATWQAAAGPDVEIIPIQCYGIIPASGAIHCIVKQVPRYTGDAPAVNIVSPAGGEILTAGGQHKIEWSAIDTNNIDPTEIEIYIDYGDSDLQHLITTADTGSYLWTLDSRIVSAASATITVVARSIDGDKTVVESQPFTISRARVTMYDFSSGAGVDKFAYGSQTSSWANVNGNALPVGTPLTTLNYARLATSNATGGDADTNRYIAPLPSPTNAESTHVFAFQLPTTLEQYAEIGVLWEGYGDFCTQVELYVWDRVAQNWGDGRGLTGINRYMDSWAGNKDGELTGAIRSDFSRYVDEAGVIRFLVYTDRPGAVGGVGQGIETFHDYMRVTLKQIGPNIPVRQV